MGISVNGSATDFALMNSIIVGCGKIGVSEAGAANDVYGTNNLFYGNRVDFQDEGSVACVGSNAINACAGMSGNRSDRNPGFAKLYDNYNFNAFYSDSPCTNTGIGGVNLGAYTNPVIVPVSSNTYYVATTGSDTNSKVQATNSTTPWKSMTNAIANAVAGDTVIVKPGTYTNSAVVEFNRCGSGQPIRFQAEGSVVLVKSGSTPQIKLTAASDVILDGFEIRGQTFAVGFSYKNIIRNCRFMRVNANGISFTGSPGNLVELCVMASNNVNVAMNDASGNNLFSKCRMLDATNTAATSGSIVFGPYSCSNIRLENCVVAGGRNHGIFMSGVAQTVFLVNSVVTGHTLDGVHVEPGTTTGGGVMLTNCIIFSNGAYGVNEVNTRMDAYPGYCCFSNNASGNFYDFDSAGGYTTASDINTLVLPVGSTTNNIVVDPLFVNAGTNDFRLLTGSLCIDAGTPTTELATAYYGNPRKQGSAVDIGIHEYPVKNNGTLIQVR